MNPYDLTEPFDLPDDEIAHLARRAERRRKTDQILSGAVIFALLAELIWNAMQKTAEVPLYVYLLLYLLWLLSVSCLRFYGDYHDKKIFQKKEEELNLGKEAKYEYNLVRYRTLKHKNKSEKHTLLLQLARQELLLDRPERARMALSEIQTDDLKKTELQTYYLYQTAASWFLKDEKWKLQLEQCIAIPIKGSELTEKELRELFAGDDRKLKERLSIWGTKNIKTFEKLPPAIRCTGILFLASGIFLAAESFFPNGSYRYYQNSLILLTTLWIGWIVLSVWWLVLLCRLVSVLLMDTGRRKALFLIWLFLVWLAINLSGILAWAKLGTKMEERQTNAMQKAIDSLVEAFGDGTEEPGMNVKEDSEAGTEAGMGQDLNQRAETSDGNTEDAENSGIRTETGSVKDNVDMSGRTVLSGGTTGTERQKASDPITEEDVQNFKIPEKLSEQGIFNESDNDDTILEGDYLGTWCDETGQEAFRLTEEGAYVYIPYLDKYGDEPYKWEIITDSSVVQDGVELDIYFSGPDIAPLVYYINGYRGDYFWSIPQADVFYRQ